MDISKITFITDKKHLICVPYNLENLHKSANHLCIDPSLFKKNHYSIKEYSKEIIEDISKSCRIVKTDNIVEIIQSPEYADIIISDEVRASGANGNSHKFEATQIQFEGGNTRYD